jgi:hypothetical protein
VLSILPQPLQSCRKSPAPKTNSPKICHPDRSGPIFSFAPNYGASGRGVEGSLFLPRLSFAFLLSPDRWSLLPDHCSLLTGHSSCPLIADNPLPRHCEVLVPKLCEGREGVVAMEKSKKHVQNPHAGHPSASWRSSLDHRRVTKPVTYYQSLANSNL